MSVALISKEKFLPILIWQNLRSKTSRAPMTSKGLWPRTLRRAGFSNLPYVNGLETPSWTTNHDFHAT